MSDHGAAPGEQPEEGPPDGPRDEEARDEEKPQAKDGKRHRSFWRELPVLIVAALVLAFLVKTFAFQAFVIPTGSMQNTLAIGDRVLVNKIVYHLRSIHRGDIVVFDGSTSWDAGQPRPSQNLFSKAVSEFEGLFGVSADNSVYIKRVIGLPGDHVQCCNAGGQLAVNGVTLSEGDYLYPGNTPSDQQFNITVPAGQLWVMGDHRAISDDSRGHPGSPGGGSIPESSVIGRAFVIVWPPGQWGFLNIPATFEQPALSALRLVTGSDLGG
ncbi:signal peptidase I [Trebonia kvetii]|uniref:Signal peptidase I n=1 Tax=Trebonia kvetii TaxID=2480626 RepID=A0A6P2C7X6_9ACTN|nr:signal peptidase I [Trebonia kvetii]TVZ06436.1 signal peptidase I [Trebonia kvetii]